MVHDFGLGVSHTLSFHVPVGHTSLLFILQTLVDVFQVTLLSVVHVFEQSVCWGQEGHKALHVELLVFHDIISVFGHTSALLILQLLFVESHIMFLLDGHTLPDSMVHVVSSQEILLVTVAHDVQSLVGGHVAVHVLLVVSHDIIPVVGHTLLESITNFSCVEFHETFLSVAHDLQLFF